MGHDKLLLALVHGESTWNEIQRSLSQHGINFPLDWVNTESISTNTISTTNIFIVFLSTVPQSSIILRLYLVNKERKWAYSESPQEDIQLDTMTLRKNSQIVSNNYWIPTCYSLPVEVNSMLTQSTGILILREFSLRIVSAYVNQTSGQLL